jgi:putative transposase
MFGCFFTALAGEWLAALYEHRQCKLSSKTGITLDTLHYKGDPLPGLIHRYGDGTAVRVLFNPDDFRFIYVPEGDELRITLVNEHVRPETPAWSIHEAKERLKNQKSKSR